MYISIFRLWIRHNMVSRYFQWR